MSNTVAESQPSTVVSKKRSVAPLVWLIVLVVAVLAFGAAIVWAGGINEALVLVGLSSPATAAQPPVTLPGGSASNATSSTATTSSAGAASAADALPKSAKSAMYREQLQSQTSIVRLVNNEVESLSFGAADESSDTAAVPVTAKFRSGSDVSGTMKLKNYDDLWYFFSLTSSDGGTERPPSSGIDSSVVSVITRQQASAENQEMIQNGLLGGGYTVARVTGVEKGSGTATVKVAVSGGSEAESQGEFLCIEKKDGSDTYWFIAKFSAK
jgi:hypothetical protein